MDWVVRDGEGACAADGGLGLVVRLKRYLLVVERPRVCFQGGWSLPFEAGLSLTGSWVTRFHPIELLRIRFFLDNGRTFAIFEDGIVIGVTVFGALNGHCAARPLFQVLLLRGRLLLHLQGGLGLADGLEGLRVSGSPDSSPNRVLFALEGRALPIFEVGVLVRIQIIINGSVLRLIRIYTSS